jgi:hypothetical protein
MPAPSVTYTFTNGTTASASEVNTNFTDILNGVSDGTKDLSINALTCAGAATLNGNINLGNSSSDDLTVTASLASNLAIKTNATYGIGSSTIGLTGIYFGNSTFTTRIVPTTLSASNTLTLPAETDTLVALTSTQTLTNKTLTSPAISNPSITGVTLSALGSNTAPSYSFTGDANTGIYSSAADTINLTTGGTSRLSLTTTNLVSTLPIQAPAGSASAPSIRFSTETTGFYQDSTGECRLSISGTLRFLFLGAGIFRCGAGSSTTPSHSFTGDTNTGMYQDSTGEIRFATAGTERLRILSTGTVLATSFTAQSTVFFTGLGAATTGTDLVINSNEIRPKSSSERFKKNIQQLDKPFETFMHATPCRFDYKSDGAKNVVGFIAEDLYKVFPEAVNLDEEGRPFSLRNDAIIAALFLKVKELEARLAKLEA